MNSNKNWCHIIILSVCVILFFATVIAITVAVAYGLIALKKWIYDSLGIDGVGIYILWNIIN